MRERIIVVFTKNDTDTIDRYLNSLKLGRLNSDGTVGGLGESNKKIAVVGYDFSDFLVDAYKINNDDIHIIIISDEDFSVQSSLFDNLKPVLEKRKEIGICFHVSSTYKEKQENKFKSLCKKDAIFHILTSTDGKGEHHNSGLVYWSLGEIATSITNKNEDKYYEAIKKLWNIFSGDPILDAKMNICHCLLIPPKKHSEEWINLKKNWEELMKLLNRDIKDKQKLSELELTWIELIEEDIYNLYKSKSTKFLSMLDKFANSFYYLI